MQIYNFIFISQAIFQKSIKKSTKLNIGVKNLHRLQGYSDVRLWFPGVGFPVVVDFLFRMFIQSGVELLDGAKQFRCGHFLDDLLDIGWQFRIEIVSDMMLQPVDAVAVTVETFTFFETLRRNYESYGFPSKAAAGFLAHGDKPSALSGSPNEGRCLRLILD